MQNETINSRFFALRMSHMSLLLFFCTIFFGIFFLSGCSDSPKSYSLSDFMAEDQSFAYPELSWGINASEVQDKLGCTLTRFPEETVEESLDTYTGTLYASTHVDFAGRSCKLGFQFDNGKLWAASVFTEDPVQNNKSSVQDFSNLIEEARRIWGAESEAIENGSVSDPEIAPEPYLYSSYQWEHDDENGKTMAIISAVYISESEYNLSLDISKPLR